MDNKVFHKVIYNDKKKRIEILFTKKSQSSATYLTDKMLKDKTYLCYFLNNFLNKSF